ncbi:helix-turn-helix domain-containing protein [Paenibacillus lentus]
MPFANCQGNSTRFIAKILGRHHATISRELRQHSVADGY